MPGSYVTFTVKGQRGDKTGQLLKAVWSVGAKVRHARTQSSTCPLLVLPSLWVVSSVRWRVYLHPPTGTVGTKESHMETYSVWHIARAQQSPLSASMLTLSLHVGCCWEALLTHHTESPKLWVDSSACNPWVKTGSCVLADRKQHHEGNN